MWKVFGMIVGHLLGIAVWLLTGFAAARFLGISAQQAVACMFVGFMLARSAKVIEDAINGRDE